MRPSQPSSERAVLVVVSHHPATRPLPRLLMREVHLLVRAWVCTHMPVPTCTCTPARVRVCMRVCTLLYVRPLCTTRRADLIDVGQHFGHWALTCGGFYRLTDNRNRAWARQHPHSAHAGSKAHARAYAEAPKEAHVRACACACMYACVRAYEHVCACTLARELCISACVRACVRRVAPGPAIGLEALGRRAELCC